MLSQSFDGTQTNEYRKVLEIKNEKLHTNFMNGGLIWNSLNLFDEFKNVEISVKIETFGIGVSLCQLFNRYFVSTLDKHKNFFQGLS